MTTITGYIIKANHSFIDVFYSFKENKWFTDILNLHLSDIRQTEEFPTNYFEKWKEYSNIKFVKVALTIDL
jgi:hypothetical protein